MPVATNKKAKRTGTCSSLQSEKSKTTSSSVRCCEDESDASSVYHNGQEKPHESSVNGKEKSNDSSVMKGASTAESSHAKTS